MVCIWDHYDSLNVQGIRTSIENALDKLSGKGRSGIAIILIDSIVKVARMNNKYENVTVREPLSVMRKILEKYGFEEMFLDYSFYLSDKSPKVEDYTLTVFGM